MKLRRTLGIVVVICGLLLGTALSADPSNGDSGRWWEGKVEVVRGQVSINVGSLPSGATGVINVDSKTIYVTANTTYKVPGLKTAGMSDIDGKDIVAQCDIVATGLWARHIVLVPGRAEVGGPRYGYWHYAGNVTTYNYDLDMGGSITIQDKSGNLIPFQINAGDSRIVPPGATVAVGEWVTVIGYRASPGAQLTAVGIIVYLSRPPSLSHQNWTEERSAARHTERIVPERWR